MYVHGSNRYITNLILGPSNNALRSSEPGPILLQCQTIIWPNAGLLSQRHSEIYFSEILFKDQKLLFTKIHLKMSSANWWTFYLGLNVLNTSINENFTLTMQKTISPISCPEDPRLLTIIAAKHWPSTTYSWSVAVFREHCEYFWNSRFIEGSL